MDLGSCLNKSQLKTVAEESGDNTFITTVILGIQAIYVMEKARISKRTYTNTLAAGTVKQPMIYYNIGTFNALFL